MNPTCRLGPEERSSLIDRHVGARLRLARKMMNFSQDALAERLGVTFQQVQKYEKGVNRLSASRLHQVASILDVPVSYFFPEMEPVAGPAGMRGPSQSDEMIGWLRTPEGFELNVRFAKISDPNVRRQLIQLVQTIAANSDE